MDDGVGGFGDLTGFSVWSQAAFDGEILAALTAVVATKAVNPDRGVKGKHGSAMGETRNVNYSARSFCG